jgi:hypothetical protein
MWLAEMAIAYDALLSHPWGTEVSIAKLRKLRRAVAERFSKDAREQSHASKPKRDATQ